MWRKVSFFLLLCLNVGGVMFVFYYIRWNHLWQECSPIPAYQIEYHQDDTLRILIIGDSWAERHSFHQDNLLCSLLRKEVICPVKVVSKGKGGEKSREIYQLMFTNDGYGTKPFLESGVDYCIIFAGINDAAANRGTKQFCYHYKLILDLLLKNHIVPVVIEIPDVDIWYVFKNKPSKDLLGDLMKSTMTQCKMYCFHEYREALYSMLQKENLSDRVVYVPMTKWNGDGDQINPSLFTEDKIHLNREGYHKLDESIATAIADYLHQSRHHILLNNPMHQDTHH